MIQNRTARFGVPLAACGITLALLSQGFDQEKAAYTAVYIHGLAGDAAAHTYGMTAMTSADIASSLPQVWQQFENMI